MTEFVTIEAANQREIILMAKLWQNEESRALLSSELKVVRAFIEGQSNGNSRPESAQEQLQSTVVDGV